MITFSPTVRQKRPLSPSVKRERLLLLTEWGLPLDTSLWRIDIERIERVDSAIQRWCRLEMNVQWATTEHLFDLAARPAKHGAHVVSLYCLPEKTADALIPRGTMRMWSLDRRGGDYLPVVLLRATAHARGAHVYLEVRWHIDGRESISLRGLTETTTIAEVGAAWQTLNALRVIQRRRGKEVGDGFESEPEVLEQLKAALATMRWKGWKFKIETLVELLPWERDGYYTRIKRYGITKDQLRRWHEESPSPATRKAAPN